MNCVICGKEKKPDKRSDICKSCSMKKLYENQYAGLDHIFVEHKAGSRKTQKVVKFRAFCPTCGNDKGYVFKSHLNSDCSSCSHKKVHSKTTLRSSNGGYVRTYHETPHQGTVCVRSSYEVFYLEYLNSNNINYLYEPKIFVFSDQSSYMPDFYLIDTDEYIELKGLETVEYKKKMELFKVEYPNIKLSVFKKDELKALGYAPGKVRKQRTIKINGDAWTVYLHTKQQYEKLHGKTSGAITDFSDKSIHFRADDIRTTYIVHELYHVYHYYSNTFSAFLTKDQKEEVYADTVAHNIMKTYSLTFDIYNFLLTCAQNRYRLKITPELFNEEMSEEDFDKFFLLAKKAKNAKIFNKGKGIVIK